LSFRELSFRSTLAAFTALAVSSTIAVAQQPDIADPSAVGNCALVWESLTPETFGTAVRDGAEAHTTYVSGRMLWTCGTATMEADSAVKYDRLRKVDLFGNVIYQDSIRTLRSTFLTYFELDDLVIADEEVELVRLVDGSRLTGPHVEFLRAVSGVDELTIATGRPHMTFYPESDEPQEPFEIDADEAQFAGEDEARFHGRVVLQRSDVNAEADSAYLTRADGVGVMWGSPWFEAEEVRLEGDTIRFRSEDEELKEVHAEGNGFALGEQFEVRAELIDIQLAEDEIEKVWAHGEGMSEALSGGHLLFGDSLRFAMSESRIDTIYSVGRAVGIQGDTTVAAEGLRGLTPVDELPSAADRTPLDSLPALRLDSLPVAEEAPPELIEELLGSIELANPDQDSAQLASADRESSGENVDGPRLSVDGSTNWVRGDTLVAIFESRSRQAADSTGAPPSDSSDPEPADSLAPAAADSGTPAADSAADSARAPTDGTSDETDEDPVMELMTVIGSASSFYRQVRDSLSTERPSRNYMIGDRIDIVFEDGEPKTVLGKNAIGLFLEPEESVAPETEPSVPRDSAALPTTSPALSDTVPALPDSLSAPPDSLSAPPDSVRARLDRGSNRPPPGRNARERPHEKRALLRSRR